MGYGQSGHLAVCFQSSFGTTKTNSQFFIPLVSESIAETIETLVENNMYSRLAESPVHEGAHEIGGEIRTEAHPIYLGTFLKAALGQSSVTAQGSAFRHEFLPVSQDWDNYAAVPPLSVEIHRDTGSAFLYYDLLANALSLEISHGQLLSASMEVIGGQFQQKAPGTAVFKPGRPWAWDVASISHGGTAQPDIRSLLVRFENQLAAQHTISGRKTPHRIKRSGPQKVTLEGSFLFENQQLFQDFMQQTENRFLLTLNGEAVSSGYNAQLVIDLPRLRFQELTPQLTGTGALEAGFTATGVFDTTSGYALRVTLVNTQPAYL
ncbi:MAG: phage tail tube protein [Deltaproteobacteria bacterium]|nr:phage tail tube protein [Deltaproteobacteria bacterium]